MRNSLPPRVATSCCTLQSPSCDADSIARGAARGASGIGRCNVSEASGSVIRQSVRNEIAVRIFSCLVRIYNADMNLFRMNYEASWPYEDTNCAGNSSSYIQKVSFAHHLSHGAYSALYCSTSSLDQLHLFKVSIRFLRHDCSGMQNELTASGNCVAMLLLCFNILCVGRW